MAGDDGISGVRWMPLHRILARDRRLAAIHEGGHYVIARWAGLRSVQAYLKQSGTDEPRTEHTWIGQTHYFRPEIDQLSERRRMMFAVAGACAEKVWQARFGYYDICAEDPFSDANFMSDSDWAMTGRCRRDLWPAKLIRSACSAIELLQGELWQPLLQTARTLITQRTVK